MGDYMQKKKITYFVQDYDPRREAISKEVEMLGKSFKSSIFNVDTSNPISLMRITKIPFLESGIYHIYTSLGDRIFLPVLKRKPLVLTGAAPAKIEKIDKSFRHYHKIDAIVVESAHQKDYLIDLEVDEKKIRVIYPGVDLAKFRHFTARKSERLRILFASAPMTEWQINTRGIGLIVKCAKSLPDTDFVMLWRKMGYDYIMKMIKKNRLRNMIVINRTVRDVRHFYHDSDCTIVPFTSMDTEKQIPMAAIESLSSGRPVLVSNMTGICGVVKKEECGIAFEPTVDSMLSAIEKLRKKYNYYHKNCRKAAEKYFSKEEFIQNYKRLYGEL